MASIELRDCTIDIPVYGLMNRSLKGTIANATTGGRISRESGTVSTVRALDNVSMYVGAGERLALVGHNGSGKTTLLRLLAGIYEPSGGYIKTVGKISSMLDITLGMNLEATGYENIQLRGLAAGLSEKQIALIVNDAAEFSGLGEFLHLPVRTYSSGMVLRLAFSVVSTLDADIIVMDEWLSVGDSEFTERAQERLRQLVDRAKILVVATHDASLAERICNRTIVLDHGKVISDTGAPNA